MLLAPFVSQPSRMQPAPLAAGPSCPQPMLAAPALPLALAQVVPGGVVVFFPSFSYADQVHARYVLTCKLCCNTWSSWHLQKQLFLHRRAVHRGSPVGLLS